MRRHHDNAPPRHAAPPHRAWHAGDGTGRPPASGGAVAISLILLAGSPALGTALALLQGPWILMLPVLHLGGLMLWVGPLHRGWRDLVASGSTHSRTALFTAGALAGIAFGGLHAWMGPTGTGPLWKPEITASTLLHALVFAVSVGIVYNALPEEITLRRTLFAPVHERLGATAAVLVTTASFTALHLPTWLTSQTSAGGYAWQVLHKVLFGLLAGWSVVRLRSVFFALGLHVSGNALGLFIGQLQSENLPDFEISWLNAAILLIGAAVTTAFIHLLGRRRGRGT
ncbi:CPBP family intramembrane glutamic endopeptidase [Actinomyces sp. ZJ308]|uniref:CPBP family intramembrane glutamic endopeptidase n=1 Tax=Actinomyces sp. ZJ308 TaxID=2708342 RepID=UPI00141FD2F9|nr:CPBP family intramembrane glutamic endopeptidase [Actinomyces sp. ZJ308]